MSQRIRLGLSSRSAIVSSPVMLVLPREGADAFKNRRDKVRAGLSPVEPKEELRVERIVNAMRRLRRSARAKTVLAGAPAQADPARRARPLPTRPPLSTHLPYEP
jgi:hypothetical protein